MTQNLPDLREFIIDPPTLKESGITLALQPSSNFEIYRLDEVAGKPGFFNHLQNQKRCDAVLVGQHGDKTVVIFFELKSGDARDAAKQLRDSISFFCKSSETGCLHHTKWQHYQMPFPKRGHVVYAVLVGSKTRFKRDALPTNMGGKKIRFCHLAARKKRQYTLEGLLEYLERNLG